MYEEPIGDPAQAMQRFLLVRANGLIGKIAACRHDGEPEFAQKKMMQRGVREHDTQGGNSGGDRFCHVIALACAPLQAMVPVLLWVSTQREFLDRYPFVRAARTDFALLVRWEAFYVLQFFALEAFFRGYLLFTLERRFGWNACLIMAVPYCAIHWHKAPLECFAAIFAGVLLGGLALRFRSWYGGAVLHSLVAVTMDGLAYARATG